MSKKLRKGAIWAYLQACGVLENGSDAEIKAAKKAYRKQYILSYRRKQRSDSPEFTIHFSKRSGDYYKIVNAAKSHKMPVSSFIRASTLAYVSKTYVYPDRLILAELKQLLSSCLNEIGGIVKQKENYFWGKEQKFKNIEKRIEKIEVQITSKLSMPSPLEETIIKEIEQNPGYKGHLLGFLNSL